jgi:hypothetical protein
VIVSVALVGVLAVDGVAADSLRAKRRAELAAAARRAELDAFRHAVRPIVEAVFDQVQPLFDATSDTLVFGQTAVEVRSDVFNRTGVQQALARQLAALRRVQPPPEAAQDANALVQALDGLAAATVSIARTPVPAGLDATGVDAAFEVQQQLEGPTSYWAAAVMTAFGRRDLPGTPGSEVASRREAVSRAAWVLAADEACGETIDLLAYMAADHSSPPAVSDLGLTLRDGVERVLAAPVPPGDAASHEQLIGAPLRGVLQFVDETLTLATAAKNGPRQSAPQRLVKAERARPAFARAAAGFNARGATVCGRLFGPGHR